MSESESEAIQFPMESRWPVQNRVAWGGIIYKGVGRWGHSWRCTPGAKRRKEIRDGHQSLAGPSVLLVSWVLKGAVNLGRGDPAGRGLGEEVAPNDALLPSARPLR